MNEPDAWGEGLEGEQLSNGLQRAVGQVEPDLGMLVGRAAVRGRSLRRRRRAATGASVLAVVAGVAGLAQLTGVGDARQNAAAASRSPAGPVVWHGQYALTGQGLLLGVVDALPTGVQFGGASGQLTTASASSGAQPQVHVSAMASGPNDEQGSQFLSLSFDSDLAGYLAQPGTIDWLPGSPGPATGEALDCANVKPAAENEKVVCTPSTLPGGGRLRVVDRQGKQGLSVSVVYQRPDGAVIAAYTERESPIPVRSGTATQWAPPSFTADQLRAALQNPELQAWTTPEFAAKAAATVRPYDDANLPSCPGPVGLVTIMPPARPTGPARVPVGAGGTPSGSAYPGGASASPTPGAGGAGAGGVPSGRPTDLPGSGGSSGTPGDCPSSSPSKWVSSPPQVLTSTVPVWPAQP
ncbi:hypothetical protein C7C46_20125 [Streptomyces tateyamensis]|uniref:Uncharacterized protein n=1 Tax=Streptomyces tateyamensis TaxID=565073 RepID=A0A2V4P2S0_9ACTN|nr:hypothetical protein [Streptomyces tateyamensis]PYC77047.1 hypothetical protein C7C46_20125 [Streptomyces tateyamensis]